MKWWHYIIVGVFGISALGASQIPTGPCGRKTATTEKADGVEFCQKSFSTAAYKADAVSIPLEATHAKVSLSRENFPELGAGVNVVTVVADVMVDGVTYNNACGFTTDGGERPGIDGEVATESYNFCELPPGEDRTIWLTVKADTPLETTASVTFE